ncbi:MAG: murein biosynthesis integral membrane protein MurJ [Verrucomicrobia bacterium]|nr:murein biosynthesis integral membrane protein MurJ [Verrucomicrobiota bacterium]
MSQMLKSSGAMGLATMVSRLLGLVRELVYAAFMGTTEIAGAFAFAYSIPNLFRRLLGEGALTAAFIPIFKTKEKTEGEVEMWRSANAVISGLIVSASVIIGLVVIGITFALHGMALEPTTELMLRLLRIMFPYMLLVCIAAVCMGMLNARGHFFIPALGATMLNVVMIAAVLFLAPVMGEELEEQIFALAIGVVVAGIAQAAFQLPTLFGEGFHYRWVSPWRDGTVREVVRKMLPASVGVAAFQINVLITQWMAFTEQESIVAEFVYAVRLMELPQGIFGASLATVLLPTLAGFAAEKNFKDFRATLVQGTNYLFFINLLAAILLFVLAEPIIRLLFERGKFTAFSTAQVSFALICLAPGLLAFSLVNIFARAFYALGDVKIPMRISVFCLLMNILLAAMFLFVFELGAGGLGIANSISSALNVTLLVFALKKKMKNLDFSTFRMQLGRLLACAVGAGGAAWVTVHYWTRGIGHESFWSKMGEVFLPMTAATLVYFSLAVWLKIPSAQDVFVLLTKRLRR